MVVRDGRWIPPPLGTNLSAIEMNEFLRSGRDRKLVEEVFAH
jgi:hypothetical protein